MRKLIIEHKNNKQITDTLLIRRASDKVTDVFLYHTLRCLPVVVVVEGPFLSYRYQRPTVENEVYLVADAVKFVRTPALAMQVREHIHLHHEENFLDLVNVAWFAVLGRVETDDIVAAGPGIQKHLNGWRKRVRASGRCFGQELLNLLGKHDL